MTETQKQEALKKVEKSWWQSKKWLAWVIQQILMAAMGIITIVSFTKHPELGWPLVTFLVALVFMMGSSTMLLIGKQAALDATIRGFAFIGNVASTPSKIKDILTSKEESSDD